MDQARRRFLLDGTTAIGAAGAVGVAVPFVESLWPSERAKALGAPVTVDITRLEPGQKIDVEWRSKPVRVLHRTPPMLAELPKIDDRLVDPHSKVAHQPRYAQNGYRSIKPEIFVAIGICTHLGCVPTFRPEVAPADLSPEWPGGFFCPCHQSKFDLAGRVFKNLPAPTNLVIPSYRFASDTILEIGADTKNH